MPEEDFLTRKKLFVKLCRYYKLPDSTAENVETLEDYVKEVIKDLTRVNANVQEAMDNISWMDSRVNSSNLS